MDEKVIKTKGEIMIERAEDDFLAELELKSFGINFKITGGLRDFKILN